MIGQVKDSGLVRLGNVINLEGIIVGPFVGDHGIEVAGIALLTIGTGA